MGAVGKKYGSSPPSFTVDALKDQTSRSTFYTWSVGLLAARRESLSSPPTPPPPQKKAHRVRAVDDEPFEQNARDLLLNHLGLRLGKKVQEHAAEVVRVLVRVAKLIGHGVQEEVSSLGVQLVSQLRR